VSVHPLQLVANGPSQYNLIHSNALSERVGQDVTVAGIRLATHRFASRQESMWLVDMEDEHGMYQVLWSGAALERHRPLLSQREPVLIRGRVRTDRQGQAILVGYEIKRLQVSDAVKSNGTHC
jgi:DNA polymerase III alpha subunit